MITIKNLKFEKPIHPWQIRVDRSSLWGNPYPMKNNSDKEHNRVCDLYKTHFYNIITENLYYAEMQAVIDIYKQYGKLDLFCFCAPERCHAETIKEYIEYKINEEIGTI